MSKKVRVQIVEDNVMIRDFDETDQPVGQTAVGFHVVEVDRNVWWKYKVLRQALNDYEIWMESLIEEPDLPPPGA